MRFKYYLRGIGIGVTLATLLLTISFYFGKDFFYRAALSDEEIIEKATALGMVMPESDEVDSGENVSEEDNISVETSSIEEIEDAEVPMATEESADDAVSEAPADTQEASETDKTETNGSDETITYVPFTVRGGESSEIISSHLKSAGLIDDADEFNKYLNKCKVDNLIQNGTFYVKQGSTYDDLVAVLVNKDVRTTTPPKN